MMATFACANWRKFLCLLTFLAMTCLAASCGGERNISAAIAAPNTTDNAAADTITLNLTVAHADFISAAIAAPNTTDNAATDTITLNLTVAPADFISAAIAAPNTTDNAADTITLNLTIAHSDFISAAIAAPNTTDNAAADTITLNLRVAHSDFDGTLLTLAAPPNTRSLIITDSHGHSRTIKLQARYYAADLGAFIFTLSTQPSLTPSIQREIVAQINIPNAIRSMTDLTHYRRFITHDKNGNIVTLDLAMQNYDADIISVPITLDDINNKAGVFDFVIDGGRTVFMDIHNQTITLSAPITITINQSIDFMPIIVQDTVIITAAIANTIIISDPSEAKNPAHLAGHTLTIRQTIAIGETIPAESLHLSIAPIKIDATLTVIAGEGWNASENFHLPPGKEFTIVTVTITENIKMTLTTIVDMIHYITVAGDGMPSDLVVLSFISQTGEVLQITVSRQNLSAELQALPAITVVLRGEDNTILGTLILAATSTATITTTIDRYYYDTALTIAEITVYDGYSWAIPMTNTIPIFFTATVARMTVGIFADSGLPSFAILPPPNPSDGINYQNREFRRGGGLDNIKADAAYQRGYFGQGVTVAVIDSGLRTTHREFAGRVAPGYDFVRKVSSMIDHSGHGTHVAGIIGGAMDDERFHGVAPSVHIMPLRVFGEGGGEVGHISSAMEFAISRGVQVINNSWGFALRVKGTLSGMPSEVVMPSLPNFIDINDDYKNEILYLGSIIDTLNNADVIQVFAAGNAGWNLSTGVVDVYYAGNNYSSPQSVEYIINNFISDDYGAFTDFDKNAVGVDAAAPLVYSSLIGKWLAVVATDSGDTIASFSNGCGAAKYWCLAAPGVGIRSAGTSGDTAVSQGNGTSYAAPHVSGALALLISRLPQMPKPVIKAILLATATDLGESGVDDVYGHGLVNVEAAITVQGSVGLALGDCLSCAETHAAAVDNAHKRMRLSRTMAHLSQQMSNLSVAFNFMDDYTYSVPYQSFITPQQATAPLLGNAAADLLTDHRAEVNMLDASKLPTFFAATDHQNLLYYGAETQQWRFRYDLCEDCGHHLWTPSNTDTFAKPFFANQQAAASFTWQGSGGWSPFAAIDAKGDTYRQFGLQWRGIYADAQWGAEISHITEQGQVLGSDFGDGYFAVLEDGQSAQMKTFVRRELWDGWSGFAEYQWGRANNVQGALLIKHLSALRFDGWRLGLSGKSALLDGDRLRLSATQQTALRGTMQAHHCSSTTPILVEDLQYYLDSDHECKIVNVNIDAPRFMVYALGYELPTRHNLRAAIGLEYSDSDNTDELAASFALRWAL